MLKTVDLIESSRSRRLSLRSNAIDGHPSTSLSIEAMWEDLGWYRALPLILVVDHAQGIITVWTALAIVALACRLLIRLAPHPTKSQCTPSLYPGLAHLISQPFTDITGQISSYRIGITVSGLIAIVAIRYWQQGTPLPPLAYVLFIGIMGVSWILASLLSVLSALHRIISVKLSITTTTTAFHKFFRTWTGIRLCFLVFVLPVFLAHAHWASADSSFSVDPFNFPKVSRDSIILDSKISSST